MKRVFLLITTFLLSIAGTSVAQNNPMRGWHTYCGSEFSQAIGGPVPFIIAICYPPDMASNFAGTAITKVAMYSDDQYNAVGGTYNCSIYLGGEAPAEGVMVYTMTVDVPQGLGDWAEFNVSTPIWVTGDETIWIVWQTVQQLTAFPMGVCGISDPSGNGNRIWTGSQWEHSEYGDWTVKTYFNGDVPQPQPQDVYFAGNGNNEGKIWKNDTLIYSIPDTVAVNIADMKVANDSTFFSVGRTFSDLQSHVWMNDTIVFTAENNDDISRIVLDANGWTAAGGNKVWQNGTLLYEYPSDTITVSNICALAIDTVTGDIYSGGSIVNPAVYACVWKNDTVLWQNSNWSEVNDLCFDGENLYAAGSINEIESIDGAIWQNDSIVFQMENGSFYRITTFNNSLYWTGNVMDTLYVWQDGDVLYAHPEASAITTLVVNDSGVYYTGVADSIPTVWKDGEILYQPEGCDMLNALCVRNTTPPQPTYTITVESDNTEWGTVSGGGFYHYGDTAIIEAIPNLGCEFLYWNDSVTDNPRNIVITQDSTFIAYFGQLDYLIETEVSPIGSGNIIGGGTYHYGDTLALEAIANPGFIFERWADNITDNPRDIIVTQDSTFVALFNIRQYTITVISDHPEWGSVTGGGTFNYGETIQIAATANLGYMFVNWDDGVTTNPRTVVVESDATFTAVFVPLQYEITTECDPVEGGTVSGAGTYNYGSTATLTATPNEYYMFICWNDGIVTNPRRINVTGNANYKALFHFNGIPHYTLNVEANDPLLGTVSGSGTYPEGTTVEISATPNAGAIFTGWNDGNTDNPRNIVVTQNMNFKAIFTEVETFTIIVRPENPLLGITYGSGDYPLNQIVTIGATPIDGFYFAGWQDGDMNNPRTITVTGDAEYIASFSPNQVLTYTVTVNYDETQGFIIGAGTYAAGSIASIAAIPADGYYFLKWNDNTTDNPREVLVDHDIVLTAFFARASIDESGLEAINLYPNPANDIIRIEGLESEHDIQIYNTFGMLVMTTHLSDDAEINVAELSAGLYIIRIGRYALRFMK